MQKTLKTICAAALVVAFGAVPATAASPMQYGGAEVQNAQFSFSFGTSNNRQRGDGRFERRGNYYYYNGQRGYRDRRAGFRYYNGFWFPNSAFSFGFSVNSDRDRNRGSYRLSAQHVAWCHDRYRSYRTSDNSFQPYNGPRRECVSPYSR
jgi:hypothetical protein